MGHYVNVDGIPIEFLEFLGYTVYAENDDFYLLRCKGDDYILPKNSPRFLFIEDGNDAAILRNRRTIPRPPHN